MIELRAVAGAIWRDRLIAFVAFIAAFFIVAGAAIVSGPHEDGVVAAERPRGCCVRTGQTADSASAEFQQALATAIVQSGAELRDFSAPRPSFGQHLQRLTSIVTFVGSRSAVVRALGRIALLSPQVAIASAQLDHVASGDTLQAQVYLVQWVQLPERR